MCNNIFGTGKVCGIYKITNLATKEVYIGQSVDCAERIKQHIKAGLGIDNKGTNKLYKAMQKNGAWNFAFELLEKCPREELDKKEKEYIAIYESDKFGYNSTKGNG
jgi:group I intron endonuclease